MNSRESIKLPPGIESDTDPAVTDGELTEALMKHCETANEQCGREFKVIPTPEKTVGPVPHGEK